MKIEGERTIAAPRERLWEALQDPEVLARTLPGCERLEATGEDRFEGAMDIRVGPVQGRFQGTVELSEKTPPEGYHLHLKGNGAPGFVDGRGRVSLDEAEGGTRLRYAIEAQVGGRIAGVGQRLLDSSAKVIARQALDGLEQQVAHREAGGGAEAAPEAPSQAAFAGRVAKGVAADLVPPERRPLVLGALAVLLLAAIVIVLRACGG